MKHFCFVTGLYERTDPLMFARQGKSLVEAGFKVTYVVCDLEKDETIDGINIISTKFKPKDRFDRFLNTKKILWEYIKKIDADIYQLSDPELISLIPKIKKIGKPVVFNMREFYPDMLKKKHYIPKVFRNIASNFYERLIVKNFKQANAVFTVTDWISDILKNKYRIDKTYILTNFPSVNKDFELTKEEYMSRPDTLCYEGTIYTSSRQENVFDALSNIPNIHYILAGKIDETYSIIKQHPYWDKVEFINGFTLEDLPKIFARSTISNVFRDFGNRDGSLGVIKVFESMEAALPVLFADVPLYRKINEKYNCGICVDPNNKQQIEDAIKYLVENKEEAYQMGQNGRRAVVEEYNWEMQAENYVRIISELFKDNPL